MMNFHLQLEEIAARKLSGAVETNTQGVALFDISLF